MGERAEFDWHNTWMDAPPGMTPLSGQRGSGAQAGEIAVAQFTEGGSFYPACSKHGVMNCVESCDHETGEGSAYWRCLTEGCNIGAECQGWAAEGKGSE